MIVVLNSENRSSGNVNSGAFTLSSALNGTYKPISFQMLNNLYNVNSFNNKIYFDELAGPKIATLTNGFYIESQLATQIKTAMEDAGDHTYTITHNTNTNKFSFSATGNFAFQFASNTTNSARKLLGMNATDVAPEATSDVSDVPIDIGPIKQLYLKFTQAITNNILISNNNTENLVVFVNNNNDASDFGDMIRYTFTDNVQNVTFNNSTTITYTIHDIYGNLVETSNDWQLTLKKI